MGVRKLKRGSVAQSAGSHRAFFTLLLIIGLVVLTDRQAAADQSFFSPGLVDIKARYDCRFDVECIEDEPCAPTDYSVRLEVLDFGDDDELDSIVPPPNFVRLLDASGGVLLFDLSPDDKSRWILSGQAENAILMLTFDSSGARYSLHSTESLAAATYLGTCEEVE